MDLVQLYSYVPTLIKYAGIVKDILDTARNNPEIVSKLMEQAKPIVKFLTDMGAALFPNAAKDLQAVGGAIAAYDPNTTKWVQGAVNEIVKPVPPLVVDGVYGPMTRDGVIKLQGKLGLEKVDGLAGRITQAAIDAFFARQAQKNAIAATPATP
jgi:peptidoglycan hydrolase-like protein with peptidoglycan-binding domain